MYEDGGESEDGRRRTAHPAPSSPTKPIPSTSTAGSSPAARFGRSIKSYLMRYMVQAFGGDDRSVAFFRFMIAVTILGDLGDRLWNLHAHYTDEGVLPRGPAVEYFSHFSWWSVHFVSGRTDVMLLVFSVHMALGVAMLVGFYSQAAAVGIWFMHNSLHTRNILVLHGGDVLLRLLLLCACFLPLGRTWSVDAALAKRAAALERLGADSAALDSQGSLSSSPSMRRWVRAPGPLQVVSARVRSWMAPAWASPHEFMNLGILMLILQFPLMYVTSVYWKVGPEWTENYNATYFALELDYFRLPLGELFRMLPQWVLQLLTFLVWYFEKFLGVLFFVPFWTGPFHAAGAFSIVALHLSLCICLRLNTFFWAPVSGACGLLPAWFFDRVVRRMLLRTDRRPRVTVSYARPPSAAAGAASVFAPFSSATAAAATSYFAHMFCEFFLLEETQCGPMGDESGGNLGGVRGRLLTVRTSDGQAMADADAVLLLTSLSPLLWPVAVLVRLLERAMRVPCRWALSAPATQLLRLTAPRAAAGPRDSALLDLSCRVMLVPSAERAVNDESGSPASTAARREMARDLAREMSASFWSTFWTGSYIFAQLLGFFVFILGAMWCISNLGVERMKLSSTMERLVFMAHTDQNWNMFSPRPPDFNWWYVIEAVTTNGTKLELWKDEGMFTWQGNRNYTFNEPEPLHVSIRDHRWIKWYESMNSNGRNEIVRLYFGKYICREWNRRHPMLEEKLYTFRIWWVLSYVRLDGSRSPPVKQSLWDHQCYTKNPLEVKSST